MARIQNPQNEKGIKLATVDDVSTSIETLTAARIVPLEEQLNKDFENITPGDQFINIEKTSGENNLVESSISLKVTEDTTDIDAATNDNNKLVTSKVLKDVKESIGLTIKHDINSDYNTSDDETLKNKIKGINFFGEYVNVIENEDGETINLYIGKNNNNPSYSSITDSFYNPNYVYANSKNLYTLPPDATAGKEYDRTSHREGTEEIKLNNGAAIGNILDGQTINVKITTDKNTTINYSTGNIVDQCGTVTDPNNWTWSDSTETISVHGTSLIKYSKQDAQNGFTPGSATGKFSVIIDNDKVVGQNGGWYNVSVGLGTTTKSTDNIFIYPPASPNASIGEVTLEYKSIGEPRWISGLDYDASGSFTLTVKDIKNTQQAITKDKNRIKITKTGSGDADFSETVTSESSGMTVSGTATNETATYEYTKTVKVSTSEAKIVSAAVEVQAYGQTGNLVGDPKRALETATRYLYTSKDEDTDLISYFQQDGKRINNTLEDIQLGHEDAVYNSRYGNLTGTDSYRTQLLIQDGKLMYPNNDKTGRYSNAEGTRYYVRPIKFGVSGQINTIAVTVKDLSSFNNDNMRIYLVQKGNPNVQVLNWFKTASCSYGTPIADKSAPSSGKWSCTINNDVFQLRGNTDGYYLVVQMDKGNSSIGQIALA